MPHKDPEARRSYHRAYMERYRVENAERMREYQREWRMSHPGKQAEYCRAWYEKHRDRLLAHEAELERERRNHRADGSVETSQRDGENERRYCGRMTMGLDA